MNSILVSLKELRILGRYALSRFCKYEEKQTSKIETKEISPAAEGYTANIEFRILDSKKRES